MAVLDHDISEVENIDDLRDEFAELDNDETFEEFVERMLQGEIDRVGRPEDTPFSVWAETILRRDIRERKILDNCDVLNRQP
ncbi:hypothetical protein [Halopiger djelfimassiliensis]|uniref:hypothetical protein n=1 Tax=Halopiger djelfimassiliensis TaxID=1293047 RepID=UPI000677BA26|nr:hypothetical protein [Halopiger djelfimassiliensis]